MNENSSYEKALVEIIEEYNWSMVVLEYSCEEELSKHISTNKSKSMEKYG